MPKFQRVLAIETSCDDTSVAVVGHDGTVLQMLAAHQNVAHAPFGGVVPEIAGRNHTYHLMPLVEKVLSDAKLSLRDVDGIAVTSEPGLIGSLLVGLVSAKALSLASGKPFIGINHLEGHLLAPFLRDASYAPPAQFDYPYIGLAISGGHTSLYRIHGLGEYEIIGRTADDAAGEAFDKFGKMVGLGFPGGAQVDQMALKGDPKRFPFPRPMLGEDHFQFSFSGLKASALRRLQSFTAEEQEQIHRREGPLLHDLCASFQEAIVDVLLERLARATAVFKSARAVLTGGVSANSRLRLRAQAWAEASGVQLVIPPLRYCTDNAAMIGYAGIQRLNRGESSDQSLGPRPKAPLGYLHDLSEKV